MKFYGKAQSAADRILKAFRESENLPSAIAPMFLKVADDMRHCSNWSFGNQLLTAIHGYTDARGFRQWEAVGRSVRKGERAFYILSPVTCKVERGGDERIVVVGFKGTPVFGYEQTDGAPIAFGEASREFVDSLPWIEVARRWALNVTTYQGRANGALGKYRRGSTIALGVSNWSTWAHELVHAADDRLGNLTEHGQHWRSETVAELGASVLLVLAGEEEQADIGGCYKYINRYAADAKIDAATAAYKCLDRTCRAVALILSESQDKDTDGADADEDDAKAPLFN